MNEQSEVRCPICGSIQLSANKKGFSGKKAVAGALLTGGIGLLAGTVGSGKVVITCLACGHAFKDGEGKVVSANQVPPPNTNHSVAPSQEVINPSDFVIPMDERILNIVKHQSKLNAVKFVKDNTGWDLKSSKEYVDNLLEQKGLQSKGGCFIATACYGGYNTSEVLILRAYRDNTLLKSHFGRLFVNAYYLVSPPVDNAIAKSEKAKALVRKYLLKPLVAKVQKEKTNF